MGMTEVASLL